MTNFSMTWNLQTFFQDKGTKKDLSLFISEIEKKIKILEKGSLPILEKITLLQEALKELAEFDAFVLCLLSEDTSSDHATSLEGKLRLLQASLENLSSKVSQELKSMDEASFKTLLTDPNMKKISFPLEETRSLAKEKLTYDTEALITDLSIDGYHGFSQLFYTVHGNLRFQIDDQQLSFGQIDNLMHDSSREVRQKAFKSYQDVFSRYRSHFAQILNHIAGFRLQVYQKRNWTDPVYEPLISNRMTEKTLAVMWETTCKYSHLFVKYLEKKAAVLGLEKLSWHDIETPLYVSTKQTPYSQGCEMILTQLRKFSPHMALFSERALKEHWVEAENRKNKGAGGFCVGFPLKKESRIFMTYSGTDSNISTLAHELGHAYHNEIIFSHPYLSQNIKMNVAETASTMAELILSNGALDQASSKEEKLSLLDEKISRSIAFFMNIHARFLFEKDFYEERKKGYVSADKLCILMENAQKRAYHDSLGEWNPLFWASKMHFYFTDVPFYNFPYTFGYLFSLGIYSLLSKDLSSFESRYNALLFDTPLMTAEALAQKHFGMNLEESAFWEISMQESIKDLTLFFDLI